MIRSVLVAMDGSEHSRAAWKYARELAKPYGAWLRVLSVIDTRVLQAEAVVPVGAMQMPYVDPGMMATEEKEMEAKCRALLDELHTEATAEGVPTRTCLMRGLPADAILSLEGTVDMIAVGHQGNRSPLDRLFAGSVAEEVISRSSRPVLVAPEGYAPIGGVMIAYDGTTPSRHALQWGADVAFHLQKPLSVVHVNRSRERGETVLREAMDYLKPYGLKDVHTILRTGRPAEHILEAAEQGHAGLIVMGAYGQTRVREMIMGSVTEEVLRKSGKPLLMLR